MSKQFICPFHKQQLTSPCKLKKCDLWVENHEKHCSLAWARTAKDSPTTKEIAQLLGVTPLDVSSLLKRAKELLLDEVLKQSISPIFTVERSSKCYVCGKEAKFILEKYGWCSNSCFDWKPLLLVKLEEKWGNEFSSLMLKWKNLKIPTLLILTQLNYPTLKNLVWQHAGIKLCKKEELSFQKLVTPPNFPTPEILKNRIKNSQTWVLNSDTQKSHSEVS